LQNDLCGDVAFFDIPREFGHDRHCFQKTILWAAMTRYAEPEIHRCPACDAFLAWRRFRSFRFQQSEHWSDGAGHMIRLTDQCHVLCCPSCSAVLWRDELEAVGLLPERPPQLGKFARAIANWNGDRDGVLSAERAWDAVPFQQKQAQHGRDLGCQDFQRALRGLRAGDQVREVFLRRRIWWESNDHERQRSDGSLVRQDCVIPAAERRGNMARLLLLLEPVADSACERAELLRMLGHFDDAIALLRKACNPRGRLVGPYLERASWSQAGDTSLKRLSPLASLATASAN
jgi:hypothetical protein